ncbi:MAG: T9SS type A sorting domain-containing protein [Phycisphaerae bacterium]|nr:T9SS type A sorting domain-containing protein [Saprospiraceae bacterium]
MKKVLLLIAFLVAIVGGTNAQIVVSGDISTNTTWTKTNTYLLNGFVYVLDGVTLTIEAGTIIKGDKTTKGALIVTRGGKLIAEGTASEPIVFTSNEPTPTYGDWGGLILLGKAHTNQIYNGTPCLGLIEGGIDPVKGLYGAGDLPLGCEGYNNDNSGILRYVRIEYPGIAFQPNSEINGLTLGGVGSGTTIDFVQVSFSGDDSFEWFGGTVNCKHLIAYRGLDDDFDTDNGYSGNIQFALSVRDPQVADVSGSNGWEADNNATGDGTIPKSKATFSNVTVVGPSGTPNTNYRRAAHLRRNNENAIFNSVAVGAYPVGLFIDGDSCATNAQNGKLIVKNSYFNGMTTPLSTNVATFDIAAYAAANAVNSSTNAADAQLVDPFNLNQPNPRPASGSPVLTGASFTSNPRIQDAFFTSVSYAGAFGPTGDWSCPWAKWGTTNCIPAPSPGQVTVSTDITTNTTWTNDKEYTLQGFIYVTNCAVLTIQPGTVIKGDKGSKGALIVTRCAQIIANGTADAPIVFTTNDPNPTYGSWGGLILLGRAHTNQMYNGTPCLGLIEGGLDPVKGLYGGGDQPLGCEGYNNDNSGILKYVRVEYPGIAFQPNNEINGITFGGVGNGTTVDNVQVSYAGDDAFEWFGGTVNAKHLVAYRALDDDFDTDNGYSGNIQFALSVRDPQVADVSGSNGFEADNNATGSGATPKSKATFSNVTVVGPGSNPNTNYRRAAHLRRNTEQAVFNSVAVGAYPVGLFIDGDSCALNAQTDKLIVKNSFFNGMATPLSTNVLPFDIAAWATANQITSSTNSADAKLVDPFNLNLPNPRPAPLSPVLTAGNFASNPRIQDPFFTPVSYAGAFGPTGDWTCPWVKWNDAGCIPPPSITQVTVSTDITTNTTWTSDKEYTLQGFIYVTNCATLTIQPGTVIKGDKGSKGALIVTRCSKIIADGTVADPIVFSTNDPNPTYGSWGGLIILGRAHTNQIYSGTQCLGLIEGGLDPVKGLYGAGDQPLGCEGYNDDNSGILRYVRIEYPGIAFQPNNEINGITFGAVGSGTIIDYVQVSFAGDDAFEWFGGTANAKHLIAYRALDDDFDTDNGFSGNIQYAFSVRDPQVADVSGSNGFESDNNATGSGATPKTAATFSNVTVVGPSGTPNSNYRRAAHLRRSTETSLFNTLLIGNYPVGIFIDGTAAEANATSGLLEVKNTIVAGPTDPLLATAAFDIDAWYATAGWNNKLFTTSAEAKLSDPFNLDYPNAQPTFGSPVAGMGAFTAPRINKPFFDKVNYIGAFSGVNGINSDWTCLWAKYLTLNTDCFKGSVGTKDIAAFASDIKLYPTMTSDRATLEMNLVNAADLQVDIIGLDGQYFGQQVNEKASAGQQSFTLTTSQLPVGFYFVRIQVGDAVTAEKLIVVR